MLEEQTDRAHRIERLAYQRWENRGRPWGSPDEDWIAAEAMIREQEAIPTREGADPSPIECRKCCRLSWPAIAIAVAAAGRCHACVVVGTFKEAMNAIYW